MKKFVPRGIIPAMATPTDRWGNLNEDALRQLVNHLIDGGVHGLFPIGSQGEFFALSMEDKRKILEVVVSEVKGRVPVYAGTAALTTKETIETTKMARDLGIDAVSVLTPFFTSLNQKEVITFYQDVAEAVPDLPLLLYANPGRTKVPITVETVLELAKVNNIIGIKDSSGDMSISAEYIRATRDMEFSVLAGRDTLIYATLCYGGTGSITATANVEPKIPVEIYEAFIVGDHKRALDAQYRLAPLRMAFAFGSFPVVIKEALNMIGIEAGEAIKPVEPMTEENRAILHRVLIEMGAIKE